MEGCIPQGGVLVHNWAEPPEEQVAMMTNALLAAA